MRRTTEPKVRRVSLALSAHDIRQIEELAVETGATRSDVLRRALALFAYAGREAGRGNRLILTSNDGVRKVDVILPGLERIGSHTPDRPFLNREPAEKDLRVILASSQERLKPLEVIADETSADPAYEIERIVLPFSEVIVPPWPNLVSKIAKGSRDLQSLHWKEFEDLMAELLRESGWHITPMGYTKDDNIDIIAVRSVDPDVPIRMMVQCKRNDAKRGVGVSVVREVWATKWQHGFHQAMIATTSRFTRGAKRTALAWQMDLRDASGIISMCKDIASRARNI
jgi:hypothetical protein